MVKKGIFIKGMTCSGCDKIVREQALSVKGVKEAHISHINGEGYVIYDTAKTDIDSILSKIEEKGYEGFLLNEPSQQKKNSWMGYVFALVGIIIIAFFFSKLSEAIQLPQIGQNVGYGLLFVVGLLTGFHCIAMCGGFVVSYTAKDAQEGRKSHLSHVMYGAGKVLSYTIIGAIFGLLGSILVFTPLMRGIVGMLAGLFLIIFGLNMLNVFPFLKKFRLGTPRFISRFTGKHTNSSPLIIGLLNGLMIACGPLQAIYIMAAGTGSMMEGAKLLFVFGLGTLPVMLGFGYLTSIISSKMTHKILKTSGVIVILLGLIMVNRGLALTGTGLDVNSALPTLTQTQAAPVTYSGDVVNGYQEIHMDVLSSGWSPDTLIIRPNIPVKWIINGKQITSCNKAIQVPDLNLAFDIKPGEQTIEFTPTKEGTIHFTCWMGMIQGKFIVTSDASKTTQSQIAAAPQTGGSCGCGG